MLIAFNAVLSCVGSLKTRVDRMWSIFFLYFQGRKEVLYNIGAVEPLKRLASTPNRVASRLAAQALKIIGEEVPHKLSQQVPLWTCDDVTTWITQVSGHMTSSLVN